MAHHISCEVGLHSTAYFMGEACAVCGATDPAVSQPSTKFSTQMSVMITTDVTVAGRQDGTVEFDQTAGREVSASVRMAACPFCGEGSLLLSRNGDQFLAVHETRDCEAIATLRGGDLLSGLLDELAWGQDNDGGNQ